MTTAINILKMENDKIISIKRFTDGSIFTIGGKAHKSIPISWTILDIKKENDILSIQLSNYAWENVDNPYLFAGEYSEHSKNYPKTASEIESEWNFISQFIK